ncbi:MAG: YafY family transcriptional regulator [Chloroflexi bacterium]|nr:YafY family transcriptional regulator [Chloroflexota bacterium]
MRADRLLSIMMLLQTRGQITAQALADELEVTKRTIYRDVDALSGAGIPIYANGGPGGGYALLDNYRTSLTGLKEAEIRALFMLTIPSPIADLGVDQEMKTAVLKLTSSLPIQHQQQVNTIRKRLHLDAGGWFQSNEAVPHLQVVQDGVWQDLQLNLSYRRRMGASSQRIISPYGLVAKAGIWYVVAATEKGMRVFRVSRIEAVSLTKIPFTRPDGFDLRHYWTTWAADYEENLPKFPVKLRIAPELVSILPYVLDDSVRVFIETAVPDVDGWRVLDYTFERIEQAQAAILGMGTAVEVVEPRELRDNVSKIAANIATLYAD